MILDDDFFCMTKARDYAYASDCDRRQIGVYIPIKVDSIKEDLIASIGVNSPMSKQHCCNRETGDCPAIHAEVYAIMHLGSHRSEASTIYVWAETPCLNCLSFIKRFSSITRIVCLITQSYGKQYPRVLDRTAEIAKRDSYAQTLGLDVVKLDIEEIIQNEFSKHPEINLQ